MIILHTNYFRLSSSMLIIYDVILYTNYGYTFMFQ